MHCEMCDLYDPIRGCNRWWMWMFCTKWKHFSKIEPPKVETPKIEPPKVETPKIETHKICVNILLNDGSTRGYNQVHSVNSGVTYMGCFYDFYRWFFHKESPYYCFKHSKGAEIFIRSEIKLISFYYEKMEEDTKKKV